MKTNQRGVAMKEQEVRKYRKKPVIIEAIQLDSSILGRAEECEKFCDGKYDQDCKCIEIKTLEGNMLAMEGDWIIKGVKGEYYPCNPDIFEATYEPASLKSLEPKVDRFPSKAQLEYIFDESCNKLFKTQGKTFNSALKKILIPAIVSYLKEGGR